MKFKHFVSREETKCEKLYFKVNAKKKINN